MSSTPSWPAYTGNCRHVRETSAGCTQDCIRVCRNNTLSVDCTSRLQAHSLKLSDPQRRALARLRRLFLRNLGILVARRQKISAMLQVPEVASWRHASCGALEWAPAREQSTLGTRIRHRHGCQLAPVTACGVTMQASQDGAQCCRLATSTTRVLRTPRPLPGQCTPTPTPRGHIQTMTSRPEMSVRQEALALPSGDQQGQVAEAHRRTTLAMTSLRSTLRDEHHCLLQARDYLIAAAPAVHRASISNTLQACYKAQRRRSC